MKGWGSIPGVGGGVQHGPEATRRLDFIAALPKHRRLTEDKTADARQDGRRHRARVGVSHSASRPSIAVIGLIGGGVCGTVDAVPLVELPYWPKEA